MTFALDTTITLPLVFSIAALVLAWFRTRRSAVDERFKAGSDRMDRHEMRLQALEQSVKAMPGMHDIHKLDLGMERVVGSVGRVEAVLEGNQAIMRRLEEIVSRHEQHLLDSAKGGMK